LFLTLVPIFFLIFLKFAFDFVPNCIAKFVLEFFLYIVPNFVPNFELPIKVFSKAVALKIVGEKPGRFLGGNVVCKVVGLRA
jgi:hypothetical protein